MESLLTLLEPAKITTWILSKSRNYIKKFYSFILTEILVLSFDSCSGIFIKVIIQVQDLSDFSHHSRGMFWDLQSWGWFLWNNKNASNTTANMRSFIDSFCTKHLFANSSVLLLWPAHRLPILAQKNTSLLYFCINECLGI